MSFSIMAASTSLPSPCVLLFSSPPFFQWKNKQRCYKSVSKRNSPFYTSSLKSSQKRSWASNRVRCEDEVKVYQYFLNLQARLSHRNWTPAQMIITTVAQCKTSYKIICCFIIRLYKINLMPYLYLCGFAELKDNRNCWWGIRFIYSNWMGFENTHDSINK